jgi:hypothetical protein
VDFQTTTVCERRKYVSKHMEAAHKHLAAVLGRNSLPIDEAVLRLIESADHISKVRCPPEFMKLLKFSYSLLIVDMRGMCVPTGT